MSPQPGYLFLKNRRDTRLPAAPSLTYHYTRFQILVNPPPCHCEEAQRADAAIRTPPSQSAPLPAPPQGEPRPGPRTPPPLASPLGGGAPAGGGEGPHPPFLSLRGAQRRDNPSPRPIFFKFSPNFSFSGLTNSPYSFTISTRKQDGGIQPRPWSDPLPCFRTVYNQTSTGNPRVLRPGVFLFFCLFMAKRASPAGSSSAPLSPGRPRRETAPPAPPR